MVINARRDKIKAIELFKSIKKRKTDEIWKYNMKMIDETLHKGISMKIKRTLGIDKKQLYALNLKD